MQIFHICDDRFILAVTALDDCFAKKFTGPVFGLLNGLSPENDQGQVGIKVAWYHIWPVERYMGIDSSPFIGREIKFLNCPDPWSKASLGIFSNDAELDA